MPMNNYSIGLDVTITIVGSFGPVVNFANVTSFDAKQETQQIKIVGINGIVDFLELPHGWKGTIDIDRQNPALDQYIATFEANYYSGVNITGASITQTIEEVAGGTTQWRFNGVMFKLSEGGVWKGDAQVKQKLEWVASKRLAVS